MKRSLLSPILMTATTVALLVSSAAGVLPAAHAEPAMDPKRSAEIQKRSGEWMVATTAADKLSKQGKFAEAIEKYAVILDQRKTLALDLMVQQLALADLYEKSKQLDKADQFHLDAIKGREAEGGDDDPTLSYPIEQYAAYLKRVHRAADATKMTARLAYIEKQRNQPPKELVALTARKDLKNNELSEKAVEIGNIYMKRDQTSRALMAFNKAVTWNPTNSAAYCARGDAYNNLTLEGKAKADYDKAIQLNPKNARALFLRALYLEGHKRKDLALADFNRAILADPADTEALGWRGKLYQNSNKFNEAVADYTRALQIDPNSTWALMQRGLCFEGLKQYDKANADFAQLAEIFPDNSDYKEAMARVAKAAKSASGTKPKTQATQPKKDAAPAKLDAHH